jgi:16S rRNA (uracil1498-N3)-methyltransferase
MGGDCFQMSRFFVNKESIYADTIIIHGEDVDHIKKVLRLREGNSIILCDGHCREYLVEIIKIDKNDIHTKIKKTMQSISEPPTNVTLFQGIPKSDKMDFIIQKAVEIGVSSIVPVITERTVVKFSDERDIIKKVARWNKISEEAAKQSNRGRIPAVLMPVPFRDAILLDEMSLRIIPYELEQSNRLKPLLQNEASPHVSIFIGPEGGFSSSEVEDAVKANIVPITLGPRILRTETAGITVLSIIMYQIGDVG